MENLTFGACLRNSWTSTFGFILRAPWIMAGFTVVTVLMTWLSSLSPWGSGFSTFDIILLAAGLPVTIFGYSWLYFKACRFVVFNEGTRPLLPLADTRSWRAVVVYVLCGIALLVLPILFLDLAFMVAAPLGEPVRRSGGAIGFIVAAFFLSRLVLVLVTAALGRGLAFRAAWNASRGHALVIIAIVLINSIPSMILSIYFGGASLVESVFTNSVSLFSLIDALIVSFVLIQSACTASWLYRRCTNNV